MKEYTLIALFSAALTVLADRVAKTGILKKKEFYFFLAVIFVFKLFFNGFLTASGIVLYNPQMVTGLRLGSIPLEDFIFGFSMVSVSIISWEFFKQKQK